MSYISDFLIATHEHAPNVTNISLDGSTPPREHSALAGTLSAFRRLKQLRLNFPISSYPVLKSINNISQLEELSLTFNHDLEMIAEALYFPNVWSLTLRGSADGFLRFLQSSHLPGVSRLWVAARDDCMLHWEGVLQAIARHFPMVDNLIVDIGRNSVCDVEPVGFDRPTADFLPFGAFPNLKHLFIVEARLKTTSHPERSYGIDDQTLAHIHAAWPHLETLGIRNDYWMWENVAVPAASSFNRMVDAFVRKDSRLERMRLVVDLSTLPPQVPRPRVAAGAYAYLKLIWTGEPCSEDSDHYGKVIISALIEWEERHDGELLSRSIPFQFEWDVEAETATWFRTTQRAKVPFPTST